MGAYDLPLSMIEANGPYDDEEPSLEFSLEEILEEEHSLDEPNFRSPQILTLRQRIEELGQWLLETPGCTGAFLVDERGLPLLQTGVDPKLLQVPVVLWEQRQRLRRWVAVSDDYVLLSLEEGRELFLIWWFYKPECRLALGLVLESAENTDRTRRGREALLLTLSGQGGMDV